MTSINAAKIVILATDGYERSELRVPYDQLKAKGADVKIASIKTGEIKSWDKKNWGDSIAVDLSARNVKSDDFDALVLPGGQINPDILRHDEDAMRVVRDFVKSGKVVAAICHAPWLLVEARKGGDGQGHHHLPQSRRPRCLRCENRRRGRGRPPRTPRRMRTIQSVPPVSGGTLIGRHQ